MAPLLSVRDLSVAFRQGEREMLAVDRVSFEIEKGETVALVGESGSGKSVTALSVLKLLPYPAASHPSGTIHFKGRELLGLPEHEIRDVRGNDITIIFQEPMTSLNPLHTIEKQIGEILELHSGIKGAAAQARIVELLGQVGIPDPASRLQSYPHQLSGGQRQRVMIAMALANEPDLLIADEPTTALDVTVQAQILKLLKEIQTRLGMSMLFITHDLGIVRKIADRVCVMSKGKIVEQGPVERVYNAPEHPYTCALLAAEPKCEPAPLQPSAPVIVETRDLRVWFPIKRGVLRKVVGHIKAVDGVSVTVRKGETLGVVGEFGLGQDHPRPCHPATDLVRRPDRVPGQHHPGPEVQGDAAVPARHADRVPGPLRVAQPAHGGLPHHRGGTVGPPSRDERRGTRGSRGARAARRRPRSRDALPLSARVLRRPAPTHRGGAGDRARADFVMLDEPTSALDMLIQAQIVELLRDLQERRNLTYMFISHDLKVVAALASRIIVMRNGKVMEEGPAADVFANPKSDYTRALFAAAFNLETAPEGVVAQ